MDANPPSSGDYALSASYENATTLQDCFVLIGFLAERIQNLEELVHPDRLVQLPKLPSKIHGFNCINLRQDAVREALAKVGADA